MKKKKIIYLVIGILLLVGVIVGTSYAWWTYTAAQTSDNTINSDCLKLNIIDETNAINLEKAYPLTDEEAKELTPYKFTIQNVCNTSIVYDVNLEVMNTENRLLSEYVALDFNKQGKRLLNVYPSTTPSIGIESYGLTSGSLKGKESISYELSLWMDEHVKVEDDAMNKSFTSKVVVNASLNQVVDIYKEEILNGADPVLADGLIPVEIGKDGRVTKANTQNEWYSYQNKKWANAVILEDESVVYQDYEEIPESNIESYFVWIPKYSYQLWDLGEYEGLNDTIDESKVHTIPIKFGLENTNDSVEGECTTPMNEDKTQGLSGESGNCKVGDYMTHPAFISMGTNGLWVGKFETGYKGATKIVENEDANGIHPEKVQIKPDCFVYGNISVANGFYTSYNYKRELDSHLMKNTEWGAVAYLSNSIFGINNVIRISNVSFKTGYASITEPSCYNTGDGNKPCLQWYDYGGNSPALDEISAKFNTSNGFLASTTGNITGIYDMAGGTHEFVAAASMETIQSIGLSYNQYKKYIELYNVENSIDNYNKRILGDATGELGPFKAEPMQYVGRISSWYGDAANIHSNSIRILDRGNDSTTGLGAGIFTFYWARVDAYPWITFRIVLAI